MFELSTFPLSWFTWLREELSQEYMTQLWNSLMDREDAKAVIYPPKDQIFDAFNFCSPEEVKVVILGQDPYHTPGHANGLAFSTNHISEIPPSLANMFKELKRSTGIDLLNIEVPCGHLTGWAKQGVILLNTTLTVEEGKPNSHKGLGWEKFTDAVITKLNRELDGLVFCLWGKEAQAKEHLISEDHHVILKTSHPSPFSAHLGFMGCDHFNLINACLEFDDKSPIYWELNH